MTVKHGSFQDAFLEREKGVGEREKKPSLERPKSWEERRARFLEPRVESGPR